MCDNASVFTHISRGRCRQVCVAAGFLLTLALTLPIGGCGSRAGSDAGVAELPVALDKSGAEELLRYYFGAYAGAEGADPFAAGVLDRRDGRFFVDLDTLALHNPAAADSLRRVSGGDVLGWEELVRFIGATYYEARGAPETQEALQDETDYTDDDWFTVDVRGVMTTARRRVYVEKSALRAALESYHMRDEQLIYATGTTIVGEHYVDSMHVETTVMRKREDGYWDFFTYGAEGQLALQTQTEPRALESPTQCVGCHLGDRQFEPEESFPADASPGPHGPRAIYVGEAMRDAEVVTFFQEHARRPDMVLGLYNTLFVSHLRAQRRAGTIAPRDAALLRALGL